MKVTINKQLQVSIEDMDGDEVQALIEMIRGAGIIERRIFSRVLIDLTRKPADKLERKNNMTKHQILEAIKDKMQNGDGDVFDFVDWLQEFIDNQLGE